MNIWYVILEHVQSSSQFCDRCARYRAQDTSVKLSRLVSRRVGPILMRQKSTKSMSLRTKSNFLLVAACILFGSKHKHLLSFHLWFGAAVTENETRQLDFIVKINVRNQPKKSAHHKWSFLERNSTCLSPQTVKRPGICFLLTAKRSQLRNLVPTERVILSSSSPQQRGP